MRSLRLSTEKRMERIEHTSTLPPLPSPVLNRPPKTFQSFILSSLLHKSKTSVLPTGVWYPQGATTILRVLLASTTPEARTRPLSRLCSSVCPSARTAAAAAAAMRLRGIPCNTRPDTERGRGRGRGRRLTTSSQSVAWLALWTRRHDAHLSGRSDCLDRIIADRSPFTEAGCKRTRRREMGRKR